MTIKKTSNNDRQRTREDSESKQRRDREERRHEKHMRNAFRGGFHPETLRLDELDDIGYGFDDEYSPW